MHSIRLHQHYLLVEKNVISGDDLCHIPYHITHGIMWVVGGQNRNVIASPTELYTWSIFLTAIIQ